MEAGKEQRRETDRERGEARGAEQVSNKRQRWQLAAKVWHHLWPQYLPLYNSLPRVERMTDDNTS